MTHKDKEKELNEYLLRAFRKEQRKEIDQRKDTNVWIEEDEECKKRVEAEKKRDDERDGERAEFNRRWFTAK